MKHVDVSILTVVYNNEQTLGRAIESVLNQTYLPREYIVVDGKSSDRSADVARSYEQIFQEAGIIYHVISEQDRGMYDALNKGASLATGELIGQINSDDWYEPDAIETMVRLYTATHYDAAWGSLCIHKRTGERIKHAKLSVFWTTTHWCHPAMFSRREILLAYPYACENMYDDFDYITRLKVSGKKLATVDYVVSNFSFGGMSTQKSLHEIMRRVNITYGIYRKYGFSRLYWLHRLLLEFYKYIVS